jgi:hypothetical protein
VIYIALAAVLFAYLIHVFCVFASTRVRKRRARRDQDMINRYLLDRSKCE